MMDRDTYSEEGRAEHYAARPPRESESMKERAERLAQSGRDSVAREVDHLGAALHSAADELRSESDFAAPWADTLARGVDNASRYLKEHSPREIMDDVREFSQRNPYLTVGGMFAAGLAISRFLKAGQEQAEHREVL